MSSTMRSWCGRFTLESVPFAKPIGCFEFLRRSVVIRAKIRIHENCVVVLSTNVKTASYIDGADQATVPQARRQQSFSRQRQSYACS
jgi:hypothetical protein